MTTPTHDHGGTAWRALDAAVVLACLALVGVVLAMLVSNRRAGRPNSPAGPVLPVPTGETVGLVDLDALAASLPHETPAGPDDAAPVAKPARRASRKPTPEPPDAEG